MLSHRASLRFTLDRHPGKITNPLNDQLFQADYKDLDDYLEWLRGKFEEEGAYCVYFEILAQVPTN